MTPAEIRSRYASFISPPMARWAGRALTCSNFREQELKHGELIAVRISQGEKWWEIDDFLREPLGQIQEKPRDPNVYFCGFGRWHIIQLANLPKVVDHLEKRGVLDRLMVREVVDPAGCTHRRCRELNSESIAH